jgi:CHAT domain-containing protein
LEKLKKIDEIQLLPPLVEPPITETMDWPGPTASFDKFRQRVRDDQPHVIHFIGHGRLKSGHGELAFVGKDGKADWVANFARVAAESKELKLVFLQACESELSDPHTPMSGLASQCAHHNVPAVVAMQAKIRSDVAATFASAFYTALAINEPIDCAVLKGRQAIEEMVKKPAAAFAVPVLYLRSYERLIGPKDQPGAARSSGSHEYCTCPRCEFAINMADPQTCPRCRLSFYCDATDEFGRLCGHKFANPLDKFCGQCGQRVNQKPWPLIAAEPPLSDSINLSPAGSSRPATEPPDPIRLRTGGT